MDCPSNQLTSIKIKTILQPFSRDVVNKHGGKLSPARKAASAPPPEGLTFFFLSGNIVQKINRNTLCK